MTDSATPTPHTSTSSLSIAINAMLSVTTSGTLPTNGETGQAYTATLVQAGGVGPFTWSLPSGSTLPAGLNLATSGTISGTITAAANTYTFTAKVTDSQGNSIVSGNISIKVDPALAIAAPTFPTGVVGVNYTAPPFTASGGSGSGYTFAVATGSLAPLVLGAGNGIVSGTPTTAGTLQFTAKVTDSHGYVTTSGTLSITINPAITVSLAPASPVTLDQTKTKLVTATVTNDPSSAGVTWSAITGLGTLTGSTSTTTTYNAPAVVASQSTATFTATSVTDPTKSATYSVTLVPPPSITTSSMAAGNVNGAYSSSVAMTGGIAPYTWAIQAGPTGISLSASTTNTVTVQGTPTVSGNNQTFTIKLTDAQGLSATSSGLTITVFPALVITPPVLPVGVVGVAYTSPAFTASGGSGSGYTFALASGSIAPLVLGAGNGIITGTPTTAGTLQFTVKVTDSVSNTVTTGNQSITVNPAITVSLGPVSPITLDQNKTQLVTATVGNDPLSAGVTWSAVTGLGSLSGSTSTTITYNAPAVVASASTATFTATSVTDATKSATYAVHLVPPPTITTSSMPAGNLNGAYTGTVTVSGGVSPYTWLILSAPNGLSLNGSTTSTVTVQGAPTVAGNGQTFTIKVTDAQGLTFTSSGLTIDVFSQLVLTPPSLPLPTGVQGLSYPASGTFTASGGSGSGYAWSIVAGNPLPTGLALSAASGATTSITAGPPTAAGTYPFTVKLTDSVNNTVTTSGLSITINPPISVTLSPAQPFAMDQNTTQLITAMVNNDPASAGVTWSSVTGLGSLSGSTTTTDTYNAPASIASTSIATFTATSITDPTKFTSFSVSLEPPPVIATPTFPDATLSAAYTPFAVIVSGGVAPYTWLGTTLPAGLTLSASNTNTVNLQGTPSSAGAGQTVTIKVTDAKGLTNTVSSTINVVVPSCSSSCTISGTVAGPTVAGVNVALSVGPTAKPSVTTDSGGNYSFTGLAGGTYKVTPTLSGYTFTPASPSVTTSSTTTTQSFTETSAVASYSISGTVTYGGLKTGTIFIRVYPGGCTGCNAVAGTSISTPGAYTVRGLQPQGSGGNGNGSYTVSVERDAVGTGLLNASNPSGSLLSPVTITNANLTGVDVTLVDRNPAPVALTKASVSPGPGGVAIQYTPPVDSNGEEIATSYKVYYGTGSSFTNGVGSPRTFTAQGTHDNVVFFDNVTNGATNFQMTALVNSNESAAFSLGTLTVGATTGQGTVSGTVTIPGTGTLGPMYVGVFGNGIYFEYIASPSHSQAYSVSGIPAGTYSNFAIVDMNNDGEIGVGDIQNTGDNQTPTIAVAGSGTTPGNITLAAPATTTPNVATNYQRFSGDSYSLSYNITWGTKRPVAMTLISGPNVPVPLDMAVDEHNGIQSPTFANAAVPVVGDAYQFLTTFSDSTTLTITANVTAVYVSNNLPTNLSMNPSPSANSPTLNWGVPIAPPTTSYNYSVGVYDPIGTLNWNDSGGNNSNGIPSTTTSDLYGGPSLTTGKTYNWFVQLQDANRNTAEITTTYVP